MVVVILQRTVGNHTAITDIYALQKDEFLRLIINSIRNDLISRNEAFQCLALGFIGNGQSLLAIAVPPKAHLFHAALPLPAATHVSCRHHF